MRFVIQSFFVLLVFVGCSSNPKEKPKISEIVGMWIPTTHNTWPPEQFLLLDKDYGFAATNFPASHRFGESALITGVGYWELEQSHEAFLISFHIGPNPYVFRIVGRHSPFLLSTSVYDDDESLKARRVEDKGN